MSIPVHQIIFYVFSAIVIVSALLVILLKNPVKAALFLVLAFFASSVLWMMLQAEFLALALIFVYVGAVMTLFLFVVMMLNPNIAVQREGFVRYFPFAAIILALFVGMMFYVASPSHFVKSGLMLTSQPASYSNAAAMGQLLFTKYLYPFELAAMILLAAIISAISLAFFGRKPGTKSQIIAKQLQAKKSERLRIINMEADKK